MKTLFKAAVAATVATGLFAAPAFAANSDTKPFTATAKIVKPLTLTLTNTGLDFGTIAMGNALTSSNVTVDQAGTAPTCGTNLTCSTPTPAKFTVTGVGTQTLLVDLGTPPTKLLNTLDNTKFVTFAVDAPGTVALTAGSGSFGIGGLITVASTTIDGDYSATMNVTVSYQ
jgi:hypothetical protein